MFDISRHLNLHRLLRRRTSTIGARLTGSFVIVVVLMLAGEAITISGLLILHSQFDVITREDRKQLAILRLNTDLLEFRDQLDPLIDARDTAALRNAVQSFDNKLRTDIHRAKVALETIQQQPGDLRLQVTLDTVESSFPSQVSALFELAASGDWEALRLRHERQSKGLVLLTTAAVGQVDDAVSRRRRAAIESIQRSEHSILIFVPAALLLSILAAGFMAFYGTSDVVRPLRGLDEAAHALQRGDLTYRVKPADIQELARVALAFNDAAAELQKVNDRLRRELAERVRAENEVTALNQRLLTAQEEERSRIARELHDDVVQQIAAINIRLSTFRRSLTEQGPISGHEFEILRERLAKLERSVRGLSHELHPAQLEHTGLIPTLRSHCDEVTAHTGIPVSFQLASDSFDDLPDPEALCLYRIMQEALQNVVKHSKATQAVVQLEKRNGFVYLTVLDNGVGFVAENAQSIAGIGLSSMKERVKILQGRLQIRSQPMQGTKVEAALPAPTSEN